MDCRGFTPISQTQIRVLLLDLSHDGGLRARHKIIDVNGAGRSFGKLWKSAYRYEALSYYWGDPTPTHAIHLNGVEMKIHANLHAALLALAKRRPGIPIWTDAICIDQTNVNEKAVQIQLMIEIYQTAQHVWAWLGHDGEQISSSLKLLYQIGNEDSLKDHSVLVRSEKRLPKPGDPFWERLRSIFFNPYFDRLWVIQETAAARRVTFMLGQSLVSWEDMGNLFSVAHSIRKIIGWLDGSVSIDPNLTIFRFRELEDSTLKQIIAGKLYSTLTWSSYKILEKLDDQANMQRVINASHKTAAGILRNLMSYSRKQKCTDPRDRVFALLGLMKRFWPMPVHFPWVLGDSIQRIFIEAFYFMLPISNLSDLLTLAPADPGSGLNLPSWCPDFSQRSNDAPSILKFGDVQETDWAASASHPVIERGNDTSVLTLEGTRVGSVIYVHLSPGRDLFSHKAELTLPARAAILLTWLEDCWQAVRKYLAEQKVTDEVQSRETDVQDDLFLQYWLTLFADQEILPVREDLQLKPSDFQRLLQTLRQMASAEALDLPLRQTFSAQGIAIDNLSMLAILNGNLAQKKFFVTNQRLMGLGPSTMSVGDEVWVFQGARLPSILYGPFAKPGGDPTQMSFWKHRGEAFIRPIMHGEAEAEGERLGATAGIVDLI